MAFLVLGKHCSPPRVAGTAGAAPRGVRAGAAPGAPSPSRLPRLPAEAPLLALSVPLLAPLACVPGRLRFEPSLSSLPRSSVAPALAASSARSSRGAVSDASVELPAGQPPRPRCPPLARRRCSPVFLRHVPRPRPLRPGASPVRPAAAARCPFEPAGRPPPTFTPAPCPNKPEPRPFAPLQLLRPTRAYGRSPEVGQPTRGVRIGRGAGSAVSSSDRRAGDRGVLQLGRRQPEAAGSRTRGLGRSGSDRAAGAGVASVMRHVPGLAPAMSPAAEGPGGAGSRSEDLVR